MSCGECTPLTGDYDTVGGENPLAALIDQMQQNWDLGDNAANDDLVVEIREHIRRQRVKESGYSDLSPARRGHVTGGHAMDGRLMGAHPFGRDDEMTCGRWMPEHTQAVADDVDYWSQHGVQVISIRPRVDGSGAVIGVRRLTNHIATAMQQRYNFPVYCWDAPPPPAPPTPRPPW